MTARTLTPAQRHAEALRQLRDCANRLGISPTMRQFAADPHTTIHPQTIARMHAPGGWNAAKRAAGLPVRRDITDNELLTALQHKARTLNRTPRTNDINADPRMPTAGLYIQRFGSLHAALTAAGVKPTRRTTTDMINAGAAAAEHLGRLPTFTDWKHLHAADPQLPSAWQIYRRFGSSSGAWDTFQYCILEQQH
jgi:hypothetical protein